ncbi:zinc ribbon domain-containing protein [Microbacterium sp. BWT-B31]|uniref:SCO7613 C-terminal domain-containing membrane protein n=1 Tax=Microbacterium sp. BWT-B31 TaxID=3232072 RepID=UPI00352738FB
MSAVATRRPLWSETAIERLEDFLLCPRCGERLGVQRCPRCGADYTGIGGELWDASQAAVAALRARQEVLDRVPVGPIAQPPRVAPAPAVGDVDPRIALAAAPGSSATVQSVLAVAGAGLVAVAAIVFTFFNPDLTDQLARGLIVGAVTVVFLFGARLLAARRLQFSAEAVGALGMIFLGLDVHALTALAPQHPWSIAAGATAVAGAAMTWLGLHVGIRTWLWGALVALALVPAMIGYAVGAPVPGHLGTALAAHVLIAFTARFDSRFRMPLHGERVTLTAVQLGALAVAIAQGWLFGALPAESFWLSMSGVLAASAALALFSARRIAAGLWSVIAGALGTAAFVVLGLGRWVSGGWEVAVVPAAAVAGAIVVAVLLPVPMGVRRGALAGGALAVVTLSAISPTLSAALLGLWTLYRAETLYGPIALAVVLGLAALGAGLGAFALLHERLHPAATTGAAGVLVPAPAAPNPVVTGVPEATDGSDAPAAADATAEGTTHPSSIPAPDAPRAGMRWVGQVGLWFVALSALTLLTVPGITVAGRVAIGLALAAAVSLALARVPALRRTSIATRMPLIAGAHLLVLFAVILSWRDLDLAALAGAGVVVAIACLALTVPASARFVHVGTGYAYALVVFATVLGVQGVDGVARLCLTTSAGALVAIAATFLPWVRVRSWYAILVVTSVPFLIGVAQVLVERSGWTALSTGLIFLLCLTLVVTRRAGLGTLVRVAAAAVLVPSLAVVIVCLGAQVLPGSGSPVVLPAIATVVALVLPCGPVIGPALVSKIGETDAALVRLAIEASALLTAAIAVLLALVRDAAGLGTTFLVLVILGSGAAATALWGGRRYGWALSGAAFTGALWCVWGMAGVDTLEPYLLPPALGTAIVGVVLTLRGARGMPLYAAGLLTAVVPVVAVAAVWGPPLRSYALVAAAWVLLPIAGLFARHEALRSLRPVTFVAVIVASAAGATQAIRYGLGLDAVAVAVPLVAVCLAWGIVGAAPAALAARALRRDATPDSRTARTRWLFAPAFVVVAVAAWPAIHRDWFTIWTMWALMLALLVALVAIARRGLRAPTGLPPAGFVFALAFVTAVVAWSPRDLRVEWFSLPLGAGLLLAGVLALRRAQQDAAASVRPTLNAWPAGFTGSWALLAPGIVVAMSASVAATFTDPLTWRAILVIVMALAAILAGASRRLAAPFLIGIVVLPVENALAFLVQIGREIESMPWWITLAVVGAVLLIIAVTYERRAGEEAGIAARLRDLA